MSAEIADVVDELPKGGIWNADE